MYPFLRCKLCILSASQCRTQTCFHCFSVIDEVNFGSSAKNSRTQMVQDTDILKTKNIVPLVFYETVVLVDFPVFAVHNHPLLPAKLMDTVELNEYIE